jgi:hypothetical protein
MKPRVCLFALLVTTVVHPDIIECTNGDRYNGRVVLVDEKNVKFESEINGIATLPREKIVSIQFGSPAKNVIAPAGSTLPTNQILLPKPAQSTLPKSLPTSTNLDQKAVDQVENELLIGATPEAQAMYRNMVQGLMNGKLNVGDIRQQAQSALSQLKDLQKDLDEDDNTPILGSYIGILESFLKETGKNNRQPPVAPAAPPTK